jgi:hypothetical protein
MLLVGMKNTDPIMWAGEQKFTVDDTSNHWCTQGWVRAAGRAGGGGARGRGGGAGGVRVGSEGGLTLRLYINYV